MTTTICLLMTNTQRIVSAVFPPSVHKFASANTNMQQKWYMSAANSNLDAVCGHCVCVCAHQMISYRQLTLCAVRRARGRCAICVCLCVVKYLSHAIIIICVNSSISAFPNRTSFPSTFQSRVGVCACESATIAIRVLSRHNPSQSSICPRLHSCVWEALCANNQPWEMDNV